jgi:predicted Zn-dependent protease
MTKATLLQYAMIPLIFVPMSYPVYLGVMEAYMNGVPLAFLKFDRNAEAEADRLGIQYMYKAGYDPDAYVSFFGKIIQEERRQPGSVPKVFADHPPTADRIIKAQEEIKQVLPERDQYLVSTSEFDDIKTRLNTVISPQRAQNKQENQPTLIKREPKDESTTPSTSGKDSNSTGADQPPVLRRREGSGN